MTSSRSAAAVGLLVERRKDENTGSAGGSEAPEPPSWGLRGVFDDTAAGLKAAPVLGLLGVLLLVARCDPLLFRLFWRPMRPRNPPKLAQDANLRRFGDSRGVFAVLPSASKVPVMSCTTKFAVYVT